MDRSTVERAAAHLESLRQHLAERTYRHSVSAAGMMQSLAKEHRFSEEQARVCGLLHDIAKRFSKDELVALAEDYGIPITPTQCANPSLLHGPVAAEETKRLGIHDDAVYEAIYWHTTGRPELGQLALALYFADAAEPTRTYPQAARARAILEAEGFDAALRYVADGKLAHVRGKAVVDPNTEAFHAWLVNRDER